MNVKRCLAIMAITVLLLASSCALPPVITRLQAEAPGWTAPLGSLHVTCNASNPQGYTLTYNWSASGGNISGTGPEVIWTAPAEVGMYDITVRVDDGHGNDATGVIALTASNGPPPVIENLIITAIENPYLKEITTGYWVAKEYNYTIGCIASGNGTLSYDWTCTGGNISAESSNITWTAPNVESYVTVTVKVFDGVLNWVKKSIILTVKCSCEFH